MTTTKFCLWCSPTCTCFNENRRRNISS